MDPFTMVVAIVFLSLGAGLFHKLVDKWAEVAKARALGRSDALGMEMQALREEVRQLREQNADLILTYDTAMQRLAAPVAAPPARRESGIPAPAEREPARTIQVG